MCINVSNNDTLQVLLITFLKSCLHQKNELSVHSLRERRFEKFGIEDPLVATVPGHLKIEDHFTAPFKYKNQEK